MKTILALDPAASSGFALAHIDGRTCTVFEYGFIDVDTASLWQGDHCLNLMKRLDDIYARTPFEAVGVESYFFSKKFCSGSDVNAAYRTAIHIWCRQKGLPYTILNISNWKSFVAGSSTPSKLQVQMWGKQPAKKLYIQEALLKRHNIRFPNHSLSEKTGKPIKFRYDLVDAVAQAIYFAHCDFNCNVFSSIFPVPPDVDWDAPKPLKKKKKI